MIRPALRPRGVRASAFTCGGGVAPVRAVPPSHRKMEDSLLGLLTTYPGYLEPLGFLHKVVAREATRTLAVGAYLGRLALYYSPSFVENTDADLLRGVLMHELLHVGLGHTFDSPALYPNRRARTYAEETCVNEIVDACGLPLPGEPIRWQQYPFLCAGQSTRERYELFCKAMERESGQGSPRGRGSTAPSGNGDSPPANEGSDAEDPPGAGEAVEPDETDGLRAAPVDQCCSGEERAEVEALLHGHDPASCGDPGCGQGGDARARTLGTPAPLVPQAWSRVVMPWRRLVRMSTRRWPSRRRPERVGIVPGRRIRRLPPAIAFALDTSGSLNEAQLAAANIELAALARHAASITVIHCDRRIHHVEAYAGPLTTAHGGGGTDLRPPFEEARKLGVDALVYFTDGDGPIPSEAPGDFGFAWLFSPGARRTLPWGLALRCG